MTRIAWAAIGLGALLCVVWVSAVGRAPRSTAIPNTPAVDAGRPSVEAAISTEASAIEGETGSVSDPNEALGARQSIEPETVHVRGRVILPAETPIEEPIQLVAVAFRGRHNATTIPTADDGTFDATLPCSWQAISLELRAQSLYLPTACSVYLDSGDQTVELRPELAGQLEVQFILPRGVTDEEIAQANGLVSVDDGAQGVFGGASRTVRPARGMKVRFDSLHMTGDVTVRARIPPFRTCAAKKAFLDPGRCTQIDMQLERGAWVSGVVVTDTGQPVAGVEVSTFINSMEAPDGGPSARTDAQGHFQMAGLHAGNDHLIVMKDFGSESRGIAWFNVSSLKAGGVSEGLRIVVKP